MVPFKTVTETGETLFFLGINSEDLIRLIQGELLEVPTEKWGLEGLILVLNRPTDQLIAADVMNYLNT